MMNKNRLFWGISVMFLGFLLLLNSLGVLHINAWKFAGPMVLIFLGLWFIFNTLFQKTPQKPESLSIPSAGEEEFVLEISHGAGKLQIGAAPTSPDLLNGTFQHGVNSQVFHQGSVTKIQLTPASDPIDYLVPGNFHGMNWDIQLNTQVPVSIDLKGGANESILNLADVNVKRLDISTGASRTEVTFSEKAVISRAKINAGVSEVDLHIPTPIAASISVHGKEMSSIHVDTLRFVQQGDHYESLNYATAEKKLDLEINPGLGQVNIR